MICSQHFDASCFIQPPKEKLRFYSRKRLTKLKADAIPTLHITFDASQIEAAHFHKPLPLIDVSDTSESTCTDTLTCNDILTCTDTSTCNDISTCTDTSTCNDTSTSESKFGDNIPVSQKIQSIQHNTTAIPSTSDNVTALLEKL